MRNRGTQRTLLILAAVLGMTVFFPVSIGDHGQSADQQENLNRPSILIVNSYTRDNVWTRAEETGFEEGLRTHGVMPHVYVEYMATKKFNDEAYFKAFKDMMKVKYSKTELGCILATDDDAAAFMAENRKYIFGKAVPVVYCGVNSKKEMPEKFWGIYEKTSIVELIQLIRRLHGQEREIVVATDKTTTSNAMLSDLRERTTAEFRKHITLLQTDRVTDMEAELSRLDRQILIFLLFNRDDRGRAYDYLEGYRLFEPSIHVPTYSTWDFYLGSGITGGIFTEGTEQGRKAAELAAKVLSVGSMINSEEMEQLALRLNVLENQSSFEYPELVKWGIDQSKLPPSARILHEPVSYFKQNKALILGAVAIIAALLAIILYMLRLIHLKNLYQEELRASHEHLAAINSHLEQMVQEKAEALECTYKKLRDAEIKLMETAKAESMLNLSLQTAHELNTPVGNSITLISFIREETLQFIKDSKLKEGSSGGSEDENEFAKMILGSIDIVERSLLRMADYVRVIQERASDLPVICELPAGLENKRSAIVQHVWETVAARRQLKGVELDFTLGMEDDLERPRAQMLYGVFLALLDNCAVHGFDGDIKQPLQAEKKVQIIWTRSEVAGEEEVICEDNGKGISELQMRHIFDPMYKSDLSQTGAGMGLYNVKRVIERGLDGRIDCESQVNGYTRFTLHLPS